MTTAADRVYAIIHSLPNKMAGLNWRAFCKSDTAFLKTWLLGRAGRRLAMMAANNKKTEGKGAARGFVIARHALIALEKLARKAKTAGGELISEFLNFVLMLGIWAVRAVAGVIEMLDMGKRRRKNESPQAELDLSIFVS